MLYSVTLKLVVRQEKKIHIRVVDPTFCANLNLELRRAHFDSVTKAF